MLASTVCCTRGCTIFAPQQSKFLDDVLRLVLATCDLSAVQACCALTLSPARPIRTRILASDAHPLRYAHAAPNARNLCHAVPMGTGGASYRGCPICLHFMLSVGLAWPVCLSVMFTRRRAVSVVFIALFSLFVSSSWCTLASNQWTVAVCATHGARPHSSA
jgi:hypothetical protein